MKAARFYLAKTGANGTAQIQLRATIRLSAFDSVRVTYGTGLFVAPDEWDNKRQRVKFSDRDWINDELNKLDRIYRDIVRENIQAGTIGKMDYESFKKEIDSRYTGYDDSEKTTFNVFADDFLTDHFPGHKDYNEITAKRAAKALELFGEGVGQVELSKVSESTYLDFLKFLRGRDYSDNYISMQISKIKQLLQYAFEQGLTVGQGALSITPGQLGVKRNRGHKIALTVGEIKKLYLHEYGAEYLRRIVDVFTVQCFTGLRYSNWKDVNRGNITTIDGTEILDITAVKNSARVVLPVHPIVKEILTKYGGTIPIISEQKTRDYLKKAARQAGFTQVVNKRIKRRTVEVEKVERCELFTCHVSRNTFNSNALDAGIPARDVKKFMGHTVKDMTDVYDRRTPERIALKYSTHPFFNQF